MAYEPKAWECGETITADALNHLERGVANASGGADTYEVYLGGFNDTQNDHVITGGGIPLWASPAELYIALAQGKTIELKLTDAWESYAETMGIDVSNPKLVSIEDDASIKGTGYVTLEIERASSGQTKRDQLKYTSLSEMPLYFFKSGILD